jgi:hypothetical protein
MRSPQLPYIFSTHTLLDCEVHVAQVHIAQCPFPSCQVHFTLWTAQMSFKLPQKFEIFWAVKCLIFCLPKFLPKN